MASDYLVHKKLLTFWGNFLFNYYKKFYDSIFPTSPFITKKHLQKSKYLENFKNYVFSVNDNNKSAKVFLTPATCLHLYPSLEGKNINNRVYLGTSECFRNESKKLSKYRLQNFHMTEIVLLGDKSFVNKKKNAIKIKTEKLFNSFGFKGKFDFATDAFFLGQQSGAKMMQKLKGLKEEYVVLDNNQRVALMSVNYHEQYFGKLFKTKTKNLFADSACIAFGLERLTAFSLNVWGKSEKKWPLIFKKYGKVL